MPMNASLVTVVSDKTGSEELRCMLNSLKRKRRTRKGTLEYVTRTKGRKGEMRKKVGDLNKPLGY